MRFINPFLAEGVQDTNLPSKILLTILFMFIVGCMLGYLLEVLFRRFVSARKWVNPGFMRGPWLPLYGCGVVLMFLLSWLILSFTPDKYVFYNPTGNLFGREYVSGPTYFDLLPIAIIGISMSLLEFVAGLIFVKGFKVRLWDYSNMKGNIMGIICPVFSVIWFIVGIIFYYGLNPFVYKAFELSFAYMFGSTTSGSVAHFGFIFILGLVYGIFLVDLINSIGLFSRISKIAKNSNIVARYERLVEEQKKTRQEYKEKFIFSLPESLKRTKEKTALEKTTKKFTGFLRKAFLINPDKSSSKENYGPDGRPLKEDNENK